MDVYKDRDWLYQKYIVSKLSTIIIGEICKVSDETIRYWLKRFNIFRRTQVEAQKVFYSKKEKTNYMDRDWLYNQYWDLKKTCGEIAKLVGVDSKTIWFWLNKYGIEIRNRSEARMGMGFSDEHRRKLSIVNLGKILSEETREKMRIYRTGRKRGPMSEEQKRKISMSKMGKNVGDKASNWQGGKSFEPYCFKFNFILKEKIRNRDNRVCQLCGKSEIENGRRLSIHHIDGDKMQGCNGKEWYLTALCIACNNTANTVKNEFLIICNIVKNGVNY